MNTKQLGGLLNVAVLSGALFCAAFAGSTARSAVFSDQAALDQSAIFAQDQMFAGVGTVGIYDQGSWWAGGTGVIIGDGSWVLCAGHELTFRSFSDVRFALRDSQGQITTDVVGGSWYVYPGYTGGTGMGVDLALIHLSAAITSVTPAELYSGSQSSLIGVTACMAGFGQPGTAGNGIGAYDRIMRAGQNIIGDVSYPSVEPQYLVTRFDAPNSGLAAALEWQGSPGDSGGPWMVQDGGIWKVAAISAGGNHDPSFSFGDVTFANNVSDYLGWIQSYAAVPEPTTGALLGLGLACLVRGKRHTA